MDRSFLSHADVIQASRKCVCIRLTTYESESEAKFSKYLLTTRSGEVENTTFGLLAPDGKTKLTRTARGARQVFADSAEMTKVMNDVVTRYPAKADAKAPGLPVTLDARLGVNVAASDDQPLVLVLAADEKVRTALSETVAQLAWCKEFIGHFV